MPEKNSEARHPVVQAKDVHNRLTSGIPGLDKLMEGGFLEKDVYLITGTTGTGKTLFCLQFLWEGLQKGEKGVFFSLEELPQDVLHDAEIFGWDFKKYIDKGEFIIKYEDPFEIVDITTAVKDSVKKFGAKRVVFDSTSIFGMVFENEHELRKRLYQLIKALKETDAVVLMTAEILEDSKGLSRFGVEEFVVDGVIVLNYLDYASDDMTRSLVIRKMRRTSHGHDIYPLKIGKDGLRVSEAKKGIVI